MTARAVEGSPAVLDSQLSSPASLSLHLVISFHVCLFVHFGYSHLRAVGRHWCRDWQRASSLCSLLLEGRSHTAPNSCGSAGTTGACSKMLLASSPWPDGQAQRGFPGCLPSLCSICSHNKSSFTERLSQMFSWKMCRGECLAKMGIGKKLWCFPFSSL